MRNISSILCLSLAIALPISSSHANENNRDVAQIAIDAMAPLVADGFAGSVLVACGDDIVFEADYGVPTYGQRRPSYWIASITKQFTAAGILRLAEMDRLSLEDPVRRFFPDAPAETADITIHQLLTHQSGLPNDYAADSHADIDEAAAAILELDLETAPGMRFRYTNDGYALLAMIVELTAGERFETFMEREILRPGGMTQFGFAGQPVEPESVLPPLIDDDPIPATWGFRGPTGMRASTRDLFRWSRALHDGSVISADSVDRMTRWQVTRANGTGVGYNWFIFEEDGKRWLNTRGYESAGFNSMLQIDPATSLTIIALTHSGPAENRRDDRAPWSRAARNALVDVFSSSPDYSCNAGAWPG